MLVFIGVVAWIMQQVLRSVFSPVKDTLNAA